MPRRFLRIKEFLASPGVNVTPPTTQRFVGGGAGTACSRCSQPCRHSADLPSDDESALLRELDSNRPRRRALHQRSRSRSAVLGGNRLTHLRAARRRRSTPSGAEAVATHGGSRRPIDRLSRSFTPSTQTALLPCWRPDRCTFSDLRRSSSVGRDTTSQSRATTQATRLFSFLAHTHQSSRTASLKSVAGEGADEGRRISCARPLKPPGDRQALAH